MEKINVKLKLSLEDIDYIESESSMRLSGKSIEPNEHVPLNSYHTHDIELNKPFSILKESWDEQDIRIIESLTSTASKATIGAVVLQEGIAHLCYVTDSMTKLITKVEKSIPRKNIYSSSSQDKALESFLTTTAQSVIRNFDLQKLKVILLASPGFTAQLLFDKIINLAKGGQHNSKDSIYSIILKNKSKFIITHSSTGYLQGLEEVLLNPINQKLLSETKFAEESNILAQFQLALNNDDGRAWYGLDEVTKAINLDAVKYLMISDSLFKNDDINIRKNYIELTKTAENMGQKVYIFSSLHESGVQLNQLTGIAALLKYPMELDSDEDENDE